MTRSEDDSSNPGPADPAGPQTSGLRRLTYEEKVLRAFIREDRLVSIPAQERKRRVILGYLRERCFSENRAYPEEEVNQRLAPYHPDVAALRREMVDSGLMTRAGGEYRRA